MSVGFRPTDRYVVGAEYAIRRPDQGIFSISCAINIVGNLALRI